MYREEDDDDQWVEIPDDLLDEFMAAHVSLSRGTQHYYIIIE